MAVGVLSGNRNFEGRVHPLTRANYLLSPPLVIAYALAGTVSIDFESDPLGKILSHTHIDNLCLPPNPFAFCVVFLFLNHVFHIPLSSQNITELASHQMDVKFKARCHRRKMI